MLASVGSAACRALNAASTKSRCLTRGATSSRFIVQSATNWVGPPGIIARIGAGGGLARAADWRGRWIDPVEQSGHEVASGAASEGAVRVHAQLGDDAAGVEVYSKVARPRSRLPSPKLQRSDDQPLPHRHQRPLRVVEIPDVDRMDQGLTDDAERTVGRSRHLPDERVEPSLTTLEHRLRDQLIALVVPFARLAVDLGAEVVPQTVLFRRPLGVAVDDLGMPRNIDAPVVTRPSQSAAEWLSAWIVTTGLLATFGALEVFLRQPAL